MKPDNSIRRAIDDSLGSVRFDASDAHAVLRRTRAARSPARTHSGKQMRFALAMAMTVVMFIPAALFVLRAHSARTIVIPPADGSTAQTAQATAGPQTDVILPPETTFTANESEAIRIARACFESVCDTSIFTFEEYAVTTLSAQDGTYTVTMESIYGNGCRFSVTVRLPEGDVLSYSTPALATTPAYIDASAPEIAAWYSKYGPYLMTWPQAAQAEFSRRYEGAILRSAQPGELSMSEAVTLAKDIVRKHLPAQEGVALYGYAMLYSERAGANGVARYVVSVYPSMIEDSLPEALATVSFTAEGDDVVARLHTRP